MSCQGPMRGPASVVLGCAFSQDFTLALRHCRRPSRKEQEICAMAGKREVEDLLACTSELPCRGNPSRGTFPWLLVVGRILSNVEASLGKWTVRTNETIGIVCRDREVKLLLTCAHVLRFPKKPSLTDLGGISGPGCTWRSLTNRGIR
jgi:hypothetical protein